MRSAALTALRETAASPLSEDVPLEPVLVPEVEPEPESEPELAPELESAPELDAPFPLPGATVRLELMVPLLALMASAVPLRMSDGYLPSEKDAPQVVLMESLIMVATRSELLTPGTSGADESCVKRA